MFLASVKLSELYFVLVLSDPFCGLSVSLKLHFFGLKLKDDRINPTVVRIPSQFAFMPCALMNATMVVSCGSFVSIWVSSEVQSWSFVSLICACMATTIIGISLLRSDSYVHFVGSRNNDSGACCLTPARWTMSKPYSIARRLHLASLPVESAELTIHFNAGWSAGTVKLVSFRYGRK